MSKSNDTPKPLASIKDDKARNNLERWAIEYRQFSEEETAIKAAKKGLMDKINPLATKLRLVKVQGDGWRLNRVVRESRKISAERLVELGVKVDTVNQATEVSEAVFYTVVATKE